MKWGWALYVKLTSRKSMGEEVQRFLSAYLTLSLVCVCTHTTQSLNFLPTLCNQNKFHVYWSKCSCYLRNRQVSLSGKTTIAHLPRPSIPRASHSIHFRNFNIWRRIKMPTNAQCYHTQLKETQARGDYEAIAFQPRVCTCSWGGSGFSSSQLGLIAETSMLSKAASAVHGLNFGKSKAESRVLLGAARGYNGSDKAEVKVSQTLFVGLGMSEMSAHFCHENSRVELPPQDAHERQGKSRRVKRNLKCETD